VIGAYLDGRLRVVGGRLTRFHKASRVEAMVAELSAAGVDIVPVYDDGVCDGFEVRGRPSYPGGRLFASRGDHRIFMSLFVAGLRMRSANLFTGFEDVSLSFPGFIAEFSRAGVRTSLVEESRPAAPLPNGQVRSATGASHLA
jgi:3-phosphoshikimate 1-carboxyvinyltransferase